MAETLARLSGAGLRLGIVCDVGMSPSVVLRGFLEHHGVLGYFDHWSFSDEVGVYKPDRRIFEHALAGLGGVDPARAVHVGDLLRTDVAGAQDMGMVAVRYRAVHDDPGDVGDTGGLFEADHVIDDHAELAGDPRDRGVTYGGPMAFPTFAVACGEEASDPWVRHEGIDVRVDELARSGHLDRQDGDLADVAGLGVRVWRYGMPWRLTEPSPGVYDWQWWDRALEACDRHGLVPVVDLCHFGLPDHYPDGFGERSWVDGFVRYTEAFLARYPEPRWFTPVNEPGITAFNSGLFGMWNERGASPQAFGRALAHVTLANLEALALVDADRAGWWIGAEGVACCLVHADASDGARRAADETEALGRLVWDLHFGRPVEAGQEHVFAEVDDDVRSRLDELAIGAVPGDVSGALPLERVVAGHDLYPVSVLPFGGPAGWTPTILDRVDAYRAFARAWHERYRAAFWVAETSNLGLPVDQGEEWLGALTATLDQLVAEGLPARGICWYSRGDQYDWDSALLSPVGQVTTVGLFDADRVARPVAAAYAALAAARP